MLCAQCGFTNPEGMKFCGQCGAPLAVPEAPAERTERRQITVLFCDLVGSTALADRLDPEDYRELVNGYHALVSREIDRFEGRIAQYLGDGVLVYFGHPKAHEDDADRAVRAALRIVEKIDRLPGRPYRVRAGLHTGRVVVGSIGAGSHRESLALGPTPNVAARIQGLATPNNVFLSSATERLLRDEYRLADLGPQKLRGMAVPMTIYRLEGEAADPGSLQRRLDSRPMVDRLRQKERLGELWVEVEAGSSAAVVLRGEAGIGKSRLAHWFLQERIGAARFVVRCSERHEHSGLYPLVELLRFELGLDPAESVARVGDAVGREVQGLATDARVATLLTALLTGSDPGPEVQEVSAVLRRRWVHDFFDGWLRRKAQGRPIVLVLDDGHWSDPSTLDWLVDFVARAEAEPQVLALVTARPDFEPPAPAVGVWDEIEVDRLPEEYVQEMLDALGLEETLDEATRRELIDKTDGVPLFVEEVGRMMSDDPVPGAEESDIPASLADLLMARLDRLGDARETAQWASALGREFALDLLREVLPSGETELELHRVELIDRGVWEPAMEEGSLRFRHALIQDAAYLALIRSERREIHGRIAAVLEARSVRGIGVRAEQLGRHFAEGGEPSKAADAYLDAGRLALTRSENQEAIGLLRECLANLAQIPEDRSRVSRELQAYLALASALVAVRGYAAPEVSEVHAAAHDRSHRTQDRRESFIALRSTLPYYLVRSQMKEALRVGEELLSMAEELDDRALRLEAHTAVATPCFWLGQLGRARSEAETALSLYDTDVHRSHVARFGQDPGVLSWIYHAWACWWLGEIDTARESCAKALQLAREIRHQHTLAMALDHAGALAFYLRDHESARRLVDEQRTLAEEYGFAMWSAMGTFRSGWLDCVEGRSEVGIVVIQRSLEAFRSTGAEIARPLHLGYLAEAFAAAGRVREGLETVDEALAAADASGELHHEPELLRLRGELVVGEDPEAGLRHLREARDLALARGARSLSLRAATSAFVEGRNGEDRGMLEAIVSSFPVDLEMVDLASARAALK